MIVRRSSFVSIGVAVVAVAIQLILVRTFAASAYSVGSGCSSPPGLFRSRAAAASRLHWQQRESQLSSLSKSQQRRLRRLPPVPLLVVTSNHEADVDNHVDDGEPSGSAEENITNNHSMEVTTAGTEPVSSNKKTKKPSVRRVGGRWLSSSRRTKDTDQAPKRTHIFGVVPHGWLLFAAAVLVSLWLLLQNMFAGPQANYVYYQSSYYESRMVGTDGKVETSRKESVRTNIPSLMQDRAKGGDDSQILRQVQAFDRQIEKELETSWDDFTLF